MIDAEFDEEPLVFPDEMISHGEPLKQPEPPKPEILANPPLENTKLLMSTPVRGEWKNKNLIRHVRSLLSQHIDE